MVRGNRVVSIYQFTNSVNDSGRTAGAVRFGYGNSGGRRNGRLRKIIFIKTVKTAVFILIKTAKVPRLILTKIVKASQSKTVGKQKMNLQNLSVIEIDIGTDGTESLQERFGEIL